MSSIASSRVFIVVGGLPSTRRALSPRPMPRSIRPSGDEVQRRQRARGHARLARRRVGDTGAQPHPVRVEGHQRQERIDLLPQHVGVEQPAIAEAGRLRLPGQGDGPLDGVVGLEGEAEVHGPAAYTVGGAAPRRQPAGRRLGAACTLCAMIRQLRSRAHGGSSARSCSAAARRIVSARCWAASSRRRPGRHSPRRRRTRACPSGRLVSDDGRLTLAVPLGVDAAGRDIDRAPVHTSGALGRCLRAAATRHLVPGAGHWRPGSSIRPACRRPRTATSSGWAWRALTTPMPDPWAWLDDPHVDVVDGDYSGDGRAAPGSAPSS